MEHCDCNVIHQEIVEEVSGKMTDETKLYDLAEFFKVFGDSTRIRILSALSFSKMCVCDIAGLLNMTKSSISHQLRILKQAHLVKGIRDGKNVYYMLDDSHIDIILSMGLSHIDEGRYVAPGGEEDR